MSAQKLITEHFDLWTGAVTHKSSAGRGSNGKVELTGIKKLRELILELAVRGKLVDQDPDDEPASVLLDRIAEDKGRLVKEGKIKKPKGLLSVAEGEVPFSIPKGWSWVRLGETMEMYNGKAFKSSEWSSTGLPIVRIQNLNDPCAPINYFDGQLDYKNKIDSGTFLISWSGTPGTSFGAFIWDRGPAALNQHINKCVFFGDHLDPRFMKLAVNGQMSHFIQNAQGGVGIKHVTKGVLINALIALPPFSEQRRIIEKVDELMALCDRLEQQVGDQMEAHEVLVDTLLDALTRAADAAELAENWGRVAEHFDTLFTTEASIDKLKQTILQLAVMGRLVPQDPNDEPASVLLDSIAEEKNRLVKEGKIKNNNKPTRIFEEKVPFEIPACWSWVRLEELVTVVTSGSRGWKKFYSNEGATFVRAQDIKRDKLFFENRAFVNLPKLAEGVRTKVAFGDVLITITGANVAKSALVDEPIDEAYVSQHIALVRLADADAGDYIHKWLTANYGGRKLLLESSYGAKPGLNLNNIKDLLIPLPSKSEQHRIVEKVDELMARCDQLNVRLSEAGEIRVQLAKAVVEQAVS